MKPDEVKNSWQEISWQSLCPTKISRQRTDNVKP